LLLFIRLLSGSVGIRYASSGKILNQGVNYFSPEFRSMGMRWAQKFSKLVGEEVTPQDVGDYIYAKRRINKSFYREIIYELVNFTIHTARDSHTAAFIYIYRVLERVSYCFPLIYVSMTDDFKKSYKQVKSFFGDSGDKDEKEFFKTFITTIFAGDDVLETTVDFGFETGGSSEADAQRLCLALKRILPADLKKDELVSATEISVKYQNVGNFIIAIRNGFFHNLSKQNNLDAEALRDSDVLFHLINDKCLYWIASVFLAIFSYNMSSHEEG